MESVRGNWVRLSDQRFGRATIVITVRPHEGCTSVAILPYALPHRQMYYLSSPPPLPPHQPGSHASSPSPAERRSALPATIASTLQHPHPPKGTLNERTHHPGHGLSQDLRPVRRGGRYELRGDPGRDLRPARAQRRGQDHDAGMPGGAAPAGRGQSCVARASIRAASRRLRGTIGVQLQTSGLPETSASPRRCASSAPTTASSARTTFLGRLGLAEKLTRPSIATLSTGHQRRLALALAVAHKPPGRLPRRADRGLDVASRSELHTLIARAAGGGHDHPARHPRHGRGREAGRPRRHPAAGKIVATGTPLEVTAAGPASPRYRCTRRGSASPRPAPVCRGSPGGLIEEYAIYYSRPRSHGGRDARPSKRSVTR